MYTGLHSLRTCSASLLIGLLWGLTEQATVHRFFVPFVFVGILGSFTTFSTFALEGFTMFRSGQQMVGVAYMFALNVFALLLVFAGYAAARSVLQTLSS